MTRTATIGRALLAIGPRPADAPWLTAGRYDDGSAYLELAIGRWLLGIYA